MKYKTGHSLCDIFCLLQEVCYQYWPSSGTTVFGEYNIMLKNEEINNNGYFKRTFEVKHTNKVIELKLYLCQLKLSPLDWS